MDIGAEVRREDLRVIEWPANSVPANAISNPEEIVGRGLIMPVIQNEPILPMKLASKEAGSGLPPVIPPGQRAVSVRVNEVIGVAGYVTPGTRVDVVATVSPTQNQQDMTSKVILTDVAVLAAGTKIERDAEKDKPVAVNVVTLLVSPDESERLTLAANEGKIQLALRNPLDKESPKTLGIKSAALLGTAPPARPLPRGLPSKGAPEKVAAAASAPEPTTVEIIRGDKRAHEVVRQEQ
jgi:pilus assembly protein CpaB